MSLAFALTLFVAPLHYAAAGKSQRLTSLDQAPEGLAKPDWSSIRAAHEAGRHAFQPVAGQEGTRKARNPGQQWTTKFDQRGFLAQPKAGGWTWGLELQSYGFGEKQTAVGGTPAVKAQGQRLSYQWMPRCRSGSSMTSAGWSMASPLTSGGASLCRPPSPVRMLRRRSAIFYVQAPAALTCARRCGSHCPSGAPLGVSPSSAGGQPRHFSVTRPTL